MAYDNKGNEQFSELLWYSWMQMLYNCFLSIDSRGITKEDNSHVSSTF